MTTLAAWTRAEHAARLGDGRTFDVLIVGGGVTGAGAALDLGARGLEVALVERSDFAQGTSSRSTKLFHGGIRYLPQFHFGLVSEGLREQKVLARIADFLYHPLEFLIPLYSQYGIAGAPGWAARGWRAALALRGGLIAYDLLGGFNRPGSRHRSITPDDLLAAVPSLHATGLTGGFVYSDAQTDDARLVVTLAKTAVMRYGVTAVNQVEVQSIERLDPGFRVHLADRASGEQFPVRAHTVLAATGAFHPPTLAGGGPGLQVVRSKGSHLIVPRERLGSGDRALVLPETDDGRVLYVIPWLGHSMIGTTDTPYASEPAHPTSSPEDTAYLIRHVRRYLEVDELEPLSTFAGLRALKDSGATSTAHVSREHVIEEPVPGYVQVAGGKLTTYRRIAAEAGNVVARALGHSVRSSTDSIPLVGAGADHRRVAHVLRDAGAHPAVIEPTVARNGSDALRIAELMATDPALTAPLGDMRASLADAVHAVRHEGATRISDVTLRRTHLAWFTADHARHDAHRISEAMAVELGWTEEQRRAALATHEDELTAEGL